MIRFAERKDSRAILKIYGQYIDTPITFAYSLPSQQEFEEQMAQISSVYPYLIYEQERRIAGYVYAHRQMEREAYQWNTELSIYLDSAAVSQGIGTKLYTTLIELLKIQGIKTVYTGITIPNEKSERLHRRLGFTCLGTYHKTGYKAGAWHDVSWFEKRVKPDDSQPKPILPIGKIPRERIQSILEALL